MTISIPDTFTIDHSENYILSIRLWPGGLSFSAQHPQQAHSSIFRDIEFDKNIPYTASLKELFFANDFFAWTYKRTYVLFVSSRYTVMPEALYSEKQKDELTAYSFSTPEKRTLANTVKSESLKVVFDINEGIYEFCSRSLTNPLFVHQITPQLITFRKQNQSEAHKHLYAVIHEKAADISCFSEGKLLFVNSFGFDQTDELLYYILYVWRQTGMEQLHDYLSLAGESGLCSRLAQSLQVYLHHIGRIEIPSEAYLAGGEILQAPIDLILLSVCEL